MSDDHRCDNCAHTFDAVETPVCPVCGLRWSESPPGEELEAVARAGTATQPQRLVLEGEAPDATGRWLATDSAVDLGDRR